MRRRVIAALALIVASATATLAAPQHCPAGFELRFTARESELHVVILPKGTKFCAESTEGHVSGVIIADGEHDLDSYLPEDTFWRIYGPQEISTPTPRPTPTPTPTPSPGATPTQAPSPSGSPGASQLPDAAMSRLWKEGALVPRTRRAILGLMLIGNLLFPTPVIADAGLEAAVAEATGIVRTHDAALHERAHQRVLEIVADFAHGDLSVGEAEVVGLNRGYADPVARMVFDWLESPDHSPILRDPDYTRIGCAQTVADDPRKAGEDVTHWFVCLFSVGSTAPSPTPASPVPGTLPNTAMEDQ
jgi:hypothetical protein